MRHLTLGRCLQDVRGFHRHYKGVCDRYGPGLYSKYKQWSVWRSK
jgi:coproporphyrinogen III oxidase